MEDFIKEQIKIGLRSLPYHLLKSAVIPRSSEETEKRRSQEFICGVCHPSDDIELIKGANIGWIRVDIPYPFNEDGSVSPYYKLWKK
ncbi:MAG: hypothetical protein IKH12_03905, partial [Clostridia bacterium]|nr:hypothetical protein [Clostridia bacterium]